MSVPPAPGSPSLPRGRRVSASATARTEGRVAVLHREGRTLYRLGLGEPDFGVPVHVAEAALRAIRENRSGYTDTAGIQSLRVAFAERLEADLGIKTRPEAVVATAGAKQAIAHALAVLCADGDEVLIPVPYWVSFPEQVRLAGAEPRFVEPASPTTKISAEEVEAAATPRTRVLIINSPNNPSGAVYSRPELESIAAVCRRLDLWVISDEVYRAFVYADRGHTSIATLTGMADRTVLVDSASKTYGMPGWRLGYATGPVEVIKAMAAVASHTTSNPSTISQAAAEAALRGPQDLVEAHRRQYASRAAWLAARLSGITSLVCAGPTAGGFFAWVDASRTFGRQIGDRTIEDADGLADAALDACGIVLQPGTGFGSPRHLRMSMAAPPDEVAEGLDRLERLLQN
jgi:aspartate aminotransferase